MLLPLPVQYLIFYLQDIALISATTAAAGLPVARISASECVLQVLLTQRWFRELGN
jgi:hypothetical protein